MKEGKLLEDAKASQDQNKNCLLLFGRKTILSEIIHHSLDKCLGPMKLIISWVKSIKEHAEIILEPNYNVMC